LPATVWEDELTLHVGDVITNVENSMEEWMYGTAPDGTSGFFPDCFVTPLTPLYVSI